MDGWVGLRGVSAPSEASRLGEERGGEALDRADFAHLRSASPAARNLLTTVLVLGRLVAFCAVLVAIVGAPWLATSAHARDRGPAYELDLELDLSLGLVGAGAASGFLFLDDAGRGPACAPVCPKSQVNAFDRPAAGLYDEGWASVGDIGVFTTMAFTPLVIFLDEGLSNGLNDNVVVVEAALISAALQVSLSYAIERPRPRVYSDEAPLSERNDANAARSFYSGHVAETMAVTVAGMRTFQRLGKPATAWAVLGAGVAGTGFVGISRVLSGGHFPSDVIAGAAVGTGVGLALPALHDEPVRVLPTGLPGGGGVTVGGVLR